MILRQTCVPFRIALVAAGLLSITMLGGCPVPQTPGTPETTPEEQEPADTTLNQTPNTPSDRPVQLPETPTDTNQGDGSDNSGDGGGNDGSGQGNPPAGPAFVRVDAPFTSIVVLPGTSIDVEGFIALEGTDSLVSSELVVARDETPFDQVPDNDGAIVHAEAAALQSGRNTVSYNTVKLNGLLTNQFGRFLFGLRIKTASAQEVIKWSTGTVTLDGAAPTVAWVGAGRQGGTVDQNDHLENRDVTWVVKLNTGDNSPAHTVAVELRDAVTGEVEAEFAESGTFPAGSAVRTFTADLSDFSVGTYRYFYRVTDGLQTAAGYASGRLGITNRLVGGYDLNQLDPESPQYANEGAISQGAILQGFNFNDLAGSSIAAVPDLNGDGAAELVVGARFGKPNLTAFQGTGWGEAYLIFGNQATRLRDINTLNSVGTTVSGVTFRGIRTPLNTSWTKGLSDIAVINDMDGDNLPEIAFSFPRVESLSLAASDWVQGTPFQHPELLSDITDMGSLEYDAINYSTGEWIEDESQFTRGGIVVVSSHNALLADPNASSRKFDRVLDLHEVGQLFSWMTRPSEAPFVMDDIVAGGGVTKCGDEDVTYVEWDLYWDVWLGDGPASCWQGPGGFHTPYTDPPANPPLANPLPWTWNTPPFTDVTNPCADIDGDGNPDGCVIRNHWVDYTIIPGTTVPSSPVSWSDPGGNVAWSGFYGDKEIAGPRYYNVGGTVVPPTSVGARVLGQQRDDQFGTTVSSDGTWLYISAPDHDAKKLDVPTLPDDRDQAGVVYQLRTRAQVAGQPNLAQLWVEPGFREIPGPDPEDPPTYERIAWPHLDVEIPNRLDYTMPVPHNYIIETVGSTRGNYYSGSHTIATNSCTVPYLEPIVAAINKAWATIAPVSFEYSEITQLLGYHPYPTDTAGYRVDRTPQIVGPHKDANISFVRALGDIDGDGVRDFAVGSEKIKDPAFPYSTVGAIYIVYGRSPGLEGDYLLENLHKSPSDPSRLKGIMLKGTSAGETLARVFDSAGDFNGDGFDDVVIGNERANGKGEVIVILGSQFLESPENGWTVSGIVSAGKAIRFSGESSDDLAGANVAGIGDVDGDGLSDILVAAPGAAGGKGKVYLIYGSDTLTSTIPLSQVGTLDVQGAVFDGRGTGDQLGGGVKTIVGAKPKAPAADFPAYSRGVAGLGDIDGDGNDDYAISAMLADPNGRVDSGEVYILYGRGDH